MERLYLAKTTLRPNLDQNLDDPHLQWVPAALSEAELQSLPLRWLCFGLQGSARCHMRRITIGNWGMGGGLSLQVPSMYREN